ncbi:unnamed protein product [Lactuca saligna]|uniref:Anaphase-promoting complex subunit 4 WD40 domain-containing protein n=1 Tax=Lactuca saligna TaxID=75948 RepID=A0AA35VDG2_LACSI|nr:unnamed protein product [Lactuca saligna]
MEFQFQGDDHSIMIYYPSAAGGVAWNYIGTKLAPGSVDQIAWVWHIEPHGHSKVKDLELNWHTNSVDQLCWDPKHADLIATASGDKNVCLWDVCSEKCSHQAELSGENINITYKQDGTHVAVGNRVNEIAWNMSGDMFFLTTLPSCAGNPSLTL